MLLKAKPGYLCNSLKTTNLSNGILFDDKKFRLILLRCTHSFIVVRIFALKNQFTVSRKQKELLSTSSSINTKRLQTNKTR